MAWISQGVPGALTVKEKWGPCLACPHLLGDQLKAICKLWSALWMEKSVVTINDIIIYHLNPLKATLWQGIDRWTGLLWQDGRDQTGGSLRSDPAGTTVLPALCKCSCVREVLPQAWGRWRRVRCVGPDLAWDRNKWEASPRMLKSPSYHGYYKQVVEYQYEHQD